MHEIEVSKAVITAINIVILLGLPWMFYWHVRQVKKQRHLSDDWIIQILILFVYSIAITSEIPALWARWVAYYEVKLNMPDSMYKLAAWDRWEHLLGYIALFLLTHTFTKKTIPKPVRDFLS